MQTRFTEEQIIGVLREQEAGAKTSDFCRQHGISWKAKYGELDVSEARQLKALGTRKRIRRGFWPTPCSTMWR
jgi:putative transposase